MENIDSVPLDVPSARQEALLYVFEDDEVVIKMSIKGKVLQWDTTPEPTELLLIGCSIELIWTPKSKSNTSTPKTNSLTFNAMSGIFCCACSRSAVSVVSLLWHNGETIATRFRRRASQRKIEIYDEAYCQDAVRVVLNFSESGEETLRKSRSMDISCWRG